MGSRSRVLVIGGQRSGKSRYAEQRTLGLFASPVYVATATAGDGEMTVRIALHRERRGSTWRLIEEPLDLPGVLAREAGAGAALLVDCLTIWLANVLEAGKSAEAEGTRLVDALSVTDGNVVFVSNEVGSGIIPDNAMARHYADALGTLNQRVAAIADEVVVVVAGQPLVLKGNR